MMSEQVLFCGLFCKSLMSCFEIWYKQNFLGRVFPNRSLLQNCSFIFRVNIAVKLFM